jgi:L-threonylcarbamoyladenylate synthase
VAFPTETVYGPAQMHQSAAAKDLRCQGRPADHPVIVHISDMSEPALGGGAARAWLLAEKFWPGPLTIVLKRSPHVNDLISGGQNSIGLRVPGHPVAQQLLKAFGGGIAAPSANKFGRLSPTTAEHVREELGNAVEMVLDGGPCDVGIESTIVDLTNDPPAILRPGRVSVQQIADALLVPLGESAADWPRVPGSLASHYAPRAPLKLVQPDEIENYVRRQVVQPPVAVVARRGRPRDSKVALWQVAPETPEEYARVLYATLRRLDDAGCGLIVVEALPLLPEWVAVRDRLDRAATPDPAVQPTAAGAS